MGKVYLRFEGIDAADFNGEPLGSSAEALASANAYTDQKISALPPPLTLEELGGEPVGAGATALGNAIAYTDGKTAQTLASANAYTDQAITALPPPLTLEELGGEPVGSAATAQAAAQSYTDTQIAALPAPPTLADLGGEPLGAATVAQAAAQNYAKNYADSNFLPLIARSAPNGVAGLDAGAKLIASQLPAIAGRILQVKHFFTETETNIPNQTFVNTGLIGSITPSSSNSLIIAFLNQNGLIKINTTTSSFLNLNLYRNNNLFRKLGEGLGFSVVSAVRLPSLSYTALISDHNGQPVELKTMAQCGNGAFSFAVQFGGMASSLLLVEVLL